MLDMSSVYIGVRIEEFAHEAVIGEVAHCVRCRKLIVLVVGSSKWLFPKDAIFICRECLTADELEEAYFLGIGVPLPKDDVDPW